jgi:hypothetical protein
MPRSVVVGEPVMPDRADPIVKSGAWRALGSPEVGRRVHRRRGGELAACTGGVVLSSSRSLWPGRRALIVPKAAKCRSHRHGGGQGCNAPR